MFLLLFIALSLLTISLPTYAEEVPTTPISMPTYTVATRLDDIGNIIIFDELSQHFNFKVQYLYFDQFAPVLKAVKNKTADFSANVTYSEERAKYIDISEPTNVEYTYLFTNYNSHSPHSIKEIHTIAAANDLIFKDLFQRIYPNIKVVELDDFEHAKQMIRSGEVDGVVDNISKLKLFLSYGFDAHALNGKVPIQSVGIATAKGYHTKLVKEMVAYLHSPEMQKKLRQRMDNYQYEVRKKALRKRVVEAGFDNSKPLKVKFENVILLSEYDKNHNVFGLIADIFNQSCEVLGLTCDVVSDPDESWTGMYNDLLDNKIDILGPVTMSSRRLDKMYFSRAYFTSEAIIVKRSGYKEDVYKTISEMIIERISVVKGDYYDTLLTNMLPGQKLFRYADRVQQMQALVNGDVDYVVLNRQNYYKMLQDNVADFSTEEDLSIGVFHKSSMTVAFPKTDRGYKLAQLFSSAHQLIDTQSIINQYDIKPDWQVILKKEKAASRYIYTIFTFCTLFMVLAIWFMYKQAITDNLTKLKNRRALYQKYSRGIPPRTTLVYIDVNKFKAINDTYGHSVGDAALKRLAYLILRHWPEGAFRLGGDEFVLVGNVSKEKLESVLEQIQSFTIDIDAEHSIDVHTSCGISHYRENLMEIDAVLHLADEKMYAAKAYSRTQSDEMLVKRS
ncbi:diguanylate cyclase domain-containing protein [Vibrio sp. E150_018]